MPDQTPPSTPATDRPFVVNHGTPFWQVAALALAMLGGSGVTAWWNKPATVQPVVVSQPVVVAPATIDPVRTQVTKDDIGLSDKDKESVIALALIGDGRYELISTPVGSKRIVKQIIVSTIGDNVKPVDPKPVEPKPDDKPVEPVTTKPTAAIYFYEKDQTAIPPYVSAGLNQINRKGIDATLFEVDTTNGKSTIPERFRVPHSEAVKAGVPVLIVMAGTTVTKIIKAPKSIEEITGAVQ